MELSIDFVGINTVGEMHEQLKQAFGFPDFYGANFNALIDYLGDIRYPEYGMSELTIGENEVLNLTIKNFSYNNELITNNFFYAIQCVNDKAIRNEVSPSIHLILI